MARHSHLYSFHEEHGKLTEFSGFDMPLWYRGIVEEHNAVRNSAGLFDVSHMGRFEIKGKDASVFLNHVLPSDSPKVKQNRAFYSMITNEKGGIIDDTVTNKFSESDYLMVVNAGNRSKDWEWLEEKAKSFAVELKDVSDSIALIAFQGPLSIPIMQKVSNIDLASVKRFAVSQAEVAGRKCVISRTGYTGEDGFEIAVLESPVEDPSNALIVWNKLLELGHDKGVLPCGLGARDSLRLEAGMCLYGNDIDDNTTPVEAGLESVISTDKKEQYAGREAIESQLKNGTKRKRVGISMESGIARHGYEIKFAGKSVGTVTSGSFSPTIKKGVAMGYVPPELAGIGQSLSILVRANEFRARVTPTPFYDTKTYGYKRES
ncbi:MAG: glycine cleavage system aminomethyltransferase GcvT [Nitrososphaerales archaeon]